MAVNPNVPTPPPRPQQQVKSSRSDSVESDSYISEGESVIAPWVLLLALLALR